MAAAHSPAISDLPTVIHQHAEMALRLPPLLTPTAMGEMVGLGRETVVRTLAELLAAGVIRRGERNDLWLAPSGQAALPLEPRQSRAERG